MSELDLGAGHTLRWACWSPDREFNPQYDDVPDIERAVAFIRHPLLPVDTRQECLDQGYCEGALYPDIPEVRAILSPHAVWQVLSWDPLTLDPSIGCHCGDHGFIRGGRWTDN